MPTREIIFQEIETIADLRAVEGLQREVWGVSDLEIIPAFFLKVSRETGSVLIGAFDGERLIGFVYGMLGREGEELTVHSDMCAVLPEYRDHQLGYRLKLAQRDWCLAHGVKLVTWTFDPLQARNARLNFGKLGAVCNQYKIDYYGETTSFLHQLGTDRFWVRWMLQSERVRRRLAGESPELPVDYQPAHTRVFCDEGNAPQLNPVNSSSSVFIEIPGEIDALQRSDRDLAVRWRAATRQAFTDAIQTGYRVENFFRARRSQQPVGVYELRRH